MASIGARGAVLTAGYVDWLQLCPDDLTGAVVHEWGVVARDVGRRRRGRGLGGRGAATRSRGWSSRGPATGGRGLGDRGPATGIGEARAGVHLRGDRGEHTADESDDSDEDSGELLDLFDVGELRQIHGATFSKRLT